MPRACLVWFLSSLISPDSTIYLCISALLIRLRQLTHILTGWCDIATICYSFVLDDLAGFSTFLSDTFSSTFLVFADFVLVS